MPQTIPARNVAVFSRFSLIVGGLVITAALLFSSAVSAFAQRGVTVAFLPDADASMTIQEAASREKAGDYLLYVPSFMAFSRLPDNFNGAVWLRISLGPSFEKPVGDLHVNFGSALPGTTRLYVQRGDGFTTLASAPPKGSFTVSATEKFPDMLYARIDGTPGLWFRPVLEGASAEASGLPPTHLLLGGLFAAAMLLLLLQYVRKAEEWRLWAAITAGCGIVAAILPANPAAGAAYTPLMAAAMLMPGLVIVFFAHTARHLFNTPKNLAGYDSLLAVYYVLGAGIALVPLIPGFLYASRYLPLAFVVLVPLLFIAIVALGRSLQGATAFLCACLLAVAGVSVSAWELTTSGIPLVGDLGGPAGLALGLVLLGLTGPAKRAKEESAVEEDVFDSLDRSSQPCAQRGEPTSLALAPWGKPEEARETAWTAPPAHSDQSPAMEEAIPPLPESAASEESAPDAPAAAITILDDPFAAETPLPERPISLPADADEHRNTLFDLPMLVKKAYDEVAPLAERKNLAMSWFIAPKTGRLFKGDKALVDSALRTLLRDMVDAMDRGNVRLNVRRLPDSMDAGHIVFTITEWDARKTFRARNMAGLAEAWALAEQTGGIFSVEHSPASGTAVIFSSVFITADTPKTEKTPSGQTAAPQEAVAEPAASTALAAPKERSAETNQNGPSVEHAASESIRKFAGHPEIALPEGLEIVSISPVPAGVDGESLAEVTETGRASSRVIIADVTASGRAKMRAAFSNSSYSALEGASPQTAYALYKRNPSALVIMSGDMPEVDIAAAIHDMHTEDKDAGRAPVPVLALVGYEAQIERMAQIGCAKTLMKPFEGSTLLAAVQELAPIEGCTLTPLPEDAPATAPLEEEPALEETAALAGEIPRTPESALREALNAIPEEHAVAMAIPAEVTQSALFVTALPEETEDPAAAPQTVKKEDSGRGMGLIDMIVTEEEAVPAETPAETPTKLAGPTISATPASRPATAATTQPEPQGVKPAASVRATVTVKTPMKKQNAPSLSDPEAALEDAPASTTLVTDDGRPMQGGQPSSSGISIRLPGEEDSVFKDMMPLIPGLIHELTDALSDAATGREEKSPLLVQEAAERIAGKAESFGLTRLERMARCVERAAAADDVEPMECVLDDLASWVERYKKALSTLHRDHTW